MIGFRAQAASALAVCLLTAGSASAVDLYGIDGTGIFSFDVSSREKTRLYSKGDPESLAFGNDTIFFGDEDGTYALTGGRGRPVRLNSVSSYKLTFGDNNLYGANDSGIFRINFSSGAISAPLVTGDIESLTYGNGMLYYGNENGTYSLNPNSGVSTRLNLTPSYKLTFGDNNLYGANDSGVFRINPISGVTGAPLINRDVDSLTYAQNFLYYGYSDGTSAQAGTYAHNLSSGNATRISRDVSYDLGVFVPPPPPPPPVVEPATNPGKDTRLITMVVKNGAAVPEPFASDAPTYVITHGWQPQGNYSDAGWEFAAQPLTEGQQNVRDAIMERIAAIDAGIGKANLVLFEWEGAYTGGELGPDGTYILDGSRLARRNADFAGHVLGEELQKLFKKDYVQPVHFIGHSFGTIVNGFAVRDLDLLGALNSESDVQFTTLDAPTAAPLNAAPNFNADWFTKVLIQEDRTTKVDYLDNYYVETGPFVIGQVEGYGEPLDGASINVGRLATHTTIFSIDYPRIVKSGPDGSGPEDWITPTLDTPRPGGSFHSLPADQAFAIDVSEGFLRAPLSPSSNLPDPVTEFPGYEGQEIDGLLYAEQSPVSAFQILAIPNGARWLVFDWMVGVGGDGDWMTLHFGNDLLWSMSIDERFTGMLLDAIIDISDYAGTTDALFFSLNSVGEKNAKFYFGNMEFRGEFSPAPIPIPPAMGLFGFGLFCVGLAARRKKVASLNSTSPHFQ